MPTCVKWHGDSCVLSVRPTQSFQGHIGAFGVAARVGELGRGSGQTKKRCGAAALEICQRSTNGEAQVCEFRGVVFQGESKAHSLARRLGDCPWIRLPSRVSFPRN
jgi:hypothetical protein